MRAITIEDVTKYAVPGNLTWNPSRTVAAFEVTRSQLDKNQYQTNIWLYENGEVRQLTAGLSSGILAWNDDCHLYLRRSSSDTKTGYTDVYVIDIHGGEAILVGQLPLLVSQMKKLACGKWAVTATIDAGHPDFYKESESEQKEYIEAVKGEEDYEVLDEIPYWINGRHFTNKKRQALFLMELDPLKLKRITEPLFDVADMSVDGDTIYFAGTKWDGSQPLMNQVYRWKQDSDTIETIYGRSDYQFASLFVLNHQLYAQASDLKIYGVNQTANIYLVTKDMLVEKYVPSVSLNNSVIGDTLDISSCQDVFEDHFYTFATEEDHTVLYAFDASFHCEKLWERAGTLGSFAINEEEIVVIYQDWKAPAEVYSLNRKNGELRKVSSFCDDVMRDCYVAKPQRIDYVSGADQLHGWALLPENYDPQKKYAAILDVHGGPRCVYGETFFHEMQVWAAKGYIVLFTNIRGSDGRGDAFADIRGKYGDVDYKNLMDFVDASLAAYPSIDPDRVCITGGSYGGFMTNWVITHTDRFCCAASQRSISNWVAMTFIADIGPWFDSDQCGADSPFDYAKQWDHSPLKYVEGAKTPTLFIHSDQDHRCPLEQGMAMMQALAYQGVETKMVLFHGENHELSRSGLPKHRIRRLSEMTAWFDRHTGE